MPTLFRTDDVDEPLSCPKCDAELPTERRLKEHDAAVHGQSLTDTDGRCKMCGEPVEEAGRHLRLECEPR
jgi:hypothetical protein